MSALSTKAIAGDNKSDRGEMSNSSFRRILIAIDSSEPASWALRFASTLASQLGSALGVVHVLAPLPAAAANAGEIQSTAGIREAGNLLVAACSGVSSDVAIDRMFREGKPAEQIVDVAREWNADLIVVGTHGRHGIKRMVLGSVAADVVKHASCATLCVGRDPGKTQTIRRILVPLDSGPQATFAMEEAAKLANILGASIRLVHVTPFPGPMEPGFGFASKEMSDALRNNAQAFLTVFNPDLREGLKVDREVRSGTTADQILISAAAWPADLIVMGARSKRGLAKFVLGSTAEMVLRRSTCPVLCVSHARREN